MKERILKTLKEKLPNKDFEKSNKLIEDGVIDSLTMALLIGILNGEFNISIPFEELKTENFESLEAIVALVQRCSEEDGSKNNN